MRIRAEQMVDAFPGEPGAVIPMKSAVGARPPIIAVTVLLSLAPSSAAKAQEPRIIPPDVACPECRIVLDTVTTLDGRRSEQVGQPIALAEMSDGRVLVTPLFDGTLVAAFDQDGRFLQRVGRKGQGPGEFTGVSQIRTGPADTIRIYDRVRPRVSIFSPDFEFLDSRNLEVPPGMGRNGLVELHDGRLLTQIPIPWDEQAGFPVHVLDSMGRVLVSLGAENPQYRRGQERLMWRSLALESPDRAWIAPVTHYSLELWDLSGEKVGEIVRRPSWFTPHPQQGMGIDYDDPDHPPYPGITGVRQDQSGLLWVLVSIPDREWETALGTVQGIGGSMTAPVNRRRYFDTIVEIIDPDREVLIASERFDQELTMISESGHVVSYRENELGFPLIHIWSLKLKRQTEER